MEGIMVQVFGGALLSLNTGILLYLIKSHGNLAKEVSYMRAKVDEHEEQLP